MPELIDRQAALKKMCETCGYCEKFEKAMRSTHPDFVTDKCNNYKFIAEQPTIEPGMNTAKIAKLCNEIEDIACDIARITMNDVISAESRMIFDKAKEISAEVSAKPVTNADRIRQMTDEELAEWIDENAGCNICKKHPTKCDVDCYSGYLEYLRKEAIEDAAD